MAHTYTAIGSYDIAVTVRDTNGRTASAGTTATVTGAPTTTSIPVIPGYTVTLAAAPTSVVINGTATLTATVVPVNSPPSVTSYAWDCNNDGTIEATTTAPVNTNICTYTSAGPITSKVTVTGGAVTGSGTTTVTVAAAPPLSVAITAVPATGHGGWRSGRRVRSAA